MLELLVLDLSIVAQVSQECTFTIQAVGLLLTISAARIYNIGSQVLCLFLALTGYSRFLQALHRVGSDIPITVHSLLRKSRAVADATPILCHDCSETQNNFLIIDLLTT